MLVFPNCKINLGLNVISKRADGFHNIETVFYPISWCDALEVIENKESDDLFLYSQSGIFIEGKLEQNLIYKTWKLISTEKNIPAIKVHLHKNIPMGAGLGGGSSDAASFINLVNTKFSLGYSDSEKITIASQLGSDCAFFIKNTPMFAEGKGDEFSDITLRLDTFYILIVYPKIHSNTKEAYDGLIPKKSKYNLKKELSNLDIKLWKKVIQNDFEETLFQKYPKIKVLKDSFYTMGAIYASMSGSGSAVYGIFENEPEIKLPEEYLFYLQKPSSKIL